MIKLFDMAGILFLTVLLSILCGSNARMGVFEVTVADESQLQKLEELASKLKLDFWKQAGVGKPIKFTSGSDIDNIRFLTDNLAKINLSVKVINENLDETINTEMKQNAVQRAKTQFRAAGGDGIHSYFAPHKEYNQWLESLKDRHAGIVSLTNIGKTHEGRDTIVLKLSTGTGKKAMFLDGGIHAREWLAVSSVVWILNKMLTGHKNGDADVKEVLNKFDVYVLPVTNPDGYETTRGGGPNRLWRKNTMPVENGCKGVDLNRNFDADFGRTGVSSDPCNIVYPGTKPFSAPETRNFRDFVLSIKDKLTLFLSFHAYSQLVLSPWAYTKTPPPDNAELMRVANIMADAIYKKSGARYQAGSPANILYAASGGAYDWVKKIGVKYSYTFEVRPDGNDRQGFVAPIEWIKPAGEELYDAVIAAAKTVQ